MLVLILYIIFFFSIVFFSRKKKSYVFLSVSYWLLISYAFLIFSHFISPYHFQIKWIWILPYLLLCLFLVFCGYRTGIKRKRNKNFRFKVHIKFLFALSLIGGIMLAFDFLRNNSITLGMRVEDQTLSTIGVLGSAMTHLSIIIWIKQLYEYEYFDKKINIMGYASVLIFVIFTILSGGRQAILLLILSSFITITYSVKLRNESKSLNRKKKTSIIPLPIYIFIILIGAYFATVSVVRSQISDIDNKMDMFENTAPIKLDREFRDFARDFPAADVLVEAVYYYSHELPRLKLLYDYYDYPPTLGLSQMLYIERRFRWLWGDWIDIAWEHNEKAIEGKGKMSSHTWGTFLSNYIVDFGRFGSLIACFLTGLFLGIVASKKNYFDYNYIFTMIWICSGIIFSIQFSPLTELCWFFPLCFASFVKIK